MKLRHELALVLLLLVVAAPTRLLGLDVLPPGLFHDEAYEGIDAVRILAGARPVFLAENYGREPLYAYVVAGIVALDGPTATAVRAASALFGLLLVPVAYFWARVMFGSTTGLLVAALTAASYWVLHESRLGMRPIALPVFLALTSGLTWLAARHGRAWAWPLAGLGLGLSLYTYLPARLFPIVVAGQVALGLWAARGGRRVRRQGLAGAAVLALVALVIALPLMQYFRENPDDATARSSVVSIFASESGRADPIAVLGQNLLLNLGMFLWRGDDTLRHNLPYRPVFDLLLAPFVLLGAAVSLRRLVGAGLAPPAAQAGQVPPLPTCSGTRHAHALVWLWLAVMLLPGLLSDSAPHFLRTIGLLPALFVLPALGLLTAADWLRARVPPRAAAGRAGLLPIGAVCVVLAASQALTWWDYFVRLPREPGLAETFDAPRAALARVAGDPPPGLDLALPTPGWSYATIRYLRPRSFAPPASAHQTQVRFDRHALLLGYDLQPEPLRPDTPARLVLHWRALRELNAGLVRTVRLVDAYGRVWWDLQGEPGSGTLPTDTWTPAEFVADRVPLEPYHDTPSGDYQLELVLSQPNGGRRLPAFDPAGRQLGNSVKLGDVRLSRD